MPTAEAGERCVLSGIIGLIFSLVMWRLTGSFVGWAALFTPGTVLITLGFCRVYRADHPRP
jgi:hypothetical protein